MTTKSQYSDLSHVHYLSTINNAKRVRAIVLGMGEVSEGARVDEGSSVRLAKVDAGYTSANMRPLG